MNAMHSARPPVTRSVSTISHLPLHWRKVEPRTRNQAGGDVWHAGTVDSAFVRDFQS